MAKQKQSEKAESVVSIDCIEATNRLLVLTLIKNGVKQRRIAEALNMHESAFSRLFPKDLLRSIASRGE